MAALLTALAALPAAAAAPACPTLWQLTTVHDAAFDFFPHLIPGQFATPEDFEAVIAAGEDPDGNGFVCVKHMWGWDLNPNSHWYGLGFELGLNEPVHQILVQQDR
jgi:hypothetical protein